MKSTIPAKVWETKRVLITKLYQEEEWPLKQVIKALWSKDFHPSETQLRSRLKKWHVTKPSRKKWSTAKKPTAEATNAFERCPSPNKGGLLASPLPETGLSPSLENAAHNSLSPGATAPSGLTSEGLHNFASSENPCFPVAGFSMEHFADPHTTVGREIDLQAPRPGSSEPRYPSRPIHSPPELEKAPGNSLYRWTACLDAAGSGTPTFALQTGADVMSSFARPPTILLSMDAPQANTEHSMTPLTRPDVNLVQIDDRPREYLRESQSGRNIAPAALPTGPGDAEARTYGTETNILLEGYPSGMSPCGVYQVGYPPSKACCVQPSLWPVDNRHLG